MIGLRETLARKGRNGLGLTRSVLLLRLPSTLLVVLHEDPHVVQQCQDLASTWLKPMGLELKPSKTRITHTLAVSEGTPGFDFLGFVRHEVAYTAVMMNWT
jgi:RNA-directed DNA polymerase